MTDQEIKLKCLDIAVQTKELDIIKAAEHYYNFITNRELSNRPKIESVNA